MSENNEFDTVEDLRLPGAPNLPHPQFGVDFDARTHPGKVRPTNEDHFHVIQVGRYLRTLASSLPAGEVREETDEPGYAFTVADGIGGHAGGEVASRLAITMLMECVLQTPDWILSHEDELLAKVMVRFSRRFQTVNFALRTMAEGEPELRGMGTTLSMAASRGNDLLVVHIGDSSVFLVRRGKLHRLTREHSASQLRPDPDVKDGARLRRVLTRAIGLTETGGEPDLLHYKLADGDRLLLCTDGLTDMVSEDAIARELERAPSATAAGQSLLDLALERGGRDNVTVIVATYRLPTGAEPPKAG